MGVTKADGRYGEHESLIPMFPTIYSFDRNEGRDSEDFLLMFLKVFARRSKGADPIGEQVKLLHNSALLDPIWYRETHTDLRQSPIDVARHFLEYGVREGRDPHPLFDTSFYLERNPDVAAAGINPLVHYLTNGWSEERDPHPLFDSKYYFEQLSASKIGKINPLSHYITSGWKEGFQPHRLFDAAWYLEKYQAVLTTGTEPLAHYLQTGWREGHWPNPSLDPAKFSQNGSGQRYACFLIDLVRSRHRRAAIREIEAKPYPGNFDLPRVLFISADSQNPSHVYRIENMARGLQALGCTTEITPLHDLWRVIDRVHDFNAVIFWRIAIGSQFNWSEDIERILEDGRRHQIAIFFDVDDQVFDPKLNNASHIAGLRYLNEQQLAQYREGVRGYRDMMLRCGNVIVPTNTLKQQAEKFPVRAFCVPNGLDEAYETALARPIEPLQRKTVTIGYTPGTRTHQKDFAVAAGALAELLKLRPNVQLRILGALELSDFRELNSLIGRQVFIDQSLGRSGVFRFNQQIDINIAPLELNNPFTAAKSELKYFEAAVFGVPTVASRVGPYRQCIQTGENGYAVETESEWLAALTSLVDDPDLRRRIGGAARGHVEKTYTASAIAERMIAAIEQVRNELTLGETAPIEPDETWLDIHDYGAKRPIVINWIIAGLLIGGGGHRMILRAAYHLSRFGHRIRLYFTGTNMLAHELRVLIHEHFYPIDCPIHVYDGSMRPADVVFATYWKTVYTALQHRDVCPNVFYFVQDFEPFFFPMGSDYILAENTYREDLYAITAGPWCAHLLRQQYNAVADSFNFPIQDVYRPRLRYKLSPNILFFAKPEMPRRCYEFGVEVLKYVHEARPGVEIIMFGSTRVNPESVPFPVTCKGVLGVEDLASMYSNADVGLVFSPTNPSAVPYEMLASGLPVVDVDRLGAEQNYGGRRDIVFLAKPRAAEMAIDIAGLLDDPEERMRRSRAGLEFIAKFPDEIGMARRIEALIAERLGLVRVKEEGSKGLTPCFDSNRGQ